MEKENKFGIAFLLLLGMVGSVFAIDLPEGFDTKDELKNFVNGFVGNGEELLDELDYAYKKSWRMDKDMDEK